MLNTIQSDLMKRHIDTIILRSLYDGDRYGADIVKEVEAKSSGQFPIRTVTIYSAFRRLEAQGIIRSYWGDKARGGQRKYYAITNDGREFFAKQQAEWEYFRTIGDSLISDKDFDLSSLPPVEIPKKPRKKREPKATVIVTEQVESPASYRFNFVDESQNTTTDTQPQEQIEMFDETAQVQEITVIEDDAMGGDGNGGTTFNSTNITVNNYHFGDNKDGDTQTVADELIEEEVVEVADETENTTNSSAPVFIVINNNNQAPAQEETVAESAIDDNTDYESYADSLKNVTIEDSEPASANYFVDFEDDAEDELPEPAFFSGTGEAEPEEPAKQTTYTAYEAYPYNKAPVYATEMEPDYKNLLSKLARPAFQERQATEETVQEEYAPEPQLAYETAYTPYQDLHNNRRETTLTEVSKSIVEVGDTSLKVRNFDTILVDEYDSSNYYYSNKLMLVQNIILFAFMLVQIVVAIGVFMMVYRPQYPEPDWIYYIGAVLVAAAVPIFAFILAARDYNRTKRYKSSFRANLLWKTIVAVQLAIAIYLANIMIGMPIRVFGTGQNNIWGGDYGVRRLISFFIPMILVLNLPLSAVVFHLLYSSRRWAVDRYTDL